MLHGERALVAVLAAWTWAACGGGTGYAGDDTGEGGDHDTIEGGADGDADTGGADGDADPDPGIDDEASMPEADATACGTTQCSNCLDDDGDGLTDGFDPHCISAADNDEASFATGIPGDNQDRQWQDCFFDGNSGGGDDGCRYHTCCILGDACPADLRRGFDPARHCNISTECIENCLPGATPGCDCFGCCTIHVDGIPYTVYTNPALAPNCTLDVIDDPALCPPCTPTEDCDNPCVPADCELCPGQTVDDLPPECDDRPRCPEGQTSCTVTTDCPLYHYCSLGCCIEQVLI